jgi:hypothetical protein
VSNLFPGRLILEAKDIERETPISARDFKKAIHKTVDDGLYPPPLRGAKRGPRGKFLVLTSDFLQWFASLPDV